MLTNKQKHIKMAKYTVFNLFDSICVLKKQELIKIPSSRGQNIKDRRALHLQPLFLVEIHAHTKRDL